jgi:hypothetical protein
VCVMEGIGKARTGSRATKTTSASFERVIVEISDIEVLRSGPIANSRAARESEAEGRMLPRSSILDLSVTFGVEAITGWSSARLWVQFGLERIRLSRYCTVSIHKMVCGVEGSIMPSLEISVDLCASS